MPPPFPHLEDVRGLIALALPGRRVAACHLLSGGLINTNVKIDLAPNDESVILRLYRDGSDICRKEIALLRLLYDTILVPRLLYAAPDGFARCGPLALLEYVEGITFQELKRTNNLDAIRQASTSIGETLAKIGRFQFPGPGRLVVDATGETEVGKPFLEGPDPIPRMLDGFLASPSFRRRASDELIDRLHDFAWSWVLPNLANDRSLVHNDFGDRNILVGEKDGEWRVAAIIDWELAFSGPPLVDVGHFLRYERHSRPLREPHFSRAFVAHGGHLPDDWRQLVKLIDLTGLVESLTHDQLPDDVETELLDLVHATLEDRDPS